VTNIEKCVTNYVCLEILMRTHDDGKGVKNNEWIKRNRKSAKEAK